MLFWSALCFACLTISNALLVVDRLVLPEPVLHLPGGWSRRCSGSRS